MAHDRAGTNPVKFDVKKGNGCLVKHLQPPATTHRILMNMYICTQTPFALQPQPNIIHPTLLA